MPRQRPIAATRGGTIAITLGVVVLVGAVAALSALALRQGTGGGAGAAAERTAEPAPTFSFGPRTDAATPTPTPAPVVLAPGADERFLSIGADAAWRATAGACGGPAPVIERSGDGGVTWVDVTPTYQDISAVHSLTSFGGRHVTAVADLGAACEPTTLRSYTDGRFWESYPDAFATDSYVDTDGDIVLGGRTVAAPCAAPWGLRVEGPAAAVICDDTAYALDGDEWTALTAGALAVAATDDGVVVARTDTACTGIRVTDYRDAARDLACVPTETTGAVALDITGDRVTLWAGADLIDVG